MQQKSITTFLLMFLVSTFVYAQDDTTAEPPTLSFSGSVDTYYKYDFSGQSNIGTSFGGDQNSFSIGMLNLIAEQTIGKVSFVGDLSFGPRGGSGSLPESDIHLQNLYVSYAISDKVSVTGGYMGTFVGYEIISPTGNFNYSTAYLFTNGPFQNAGVKLDFNISEKVGLMVGVFNDWNVYSQGGNDVTSIGAQLRLSPVDGLDAYINFLTGDTNGTEIDLTATYQINDKLMLGLNAASYNNNDAEAEGKFSGVAGYANYAITDAFALGARFEQFTDDNLGILGTEKSSVSAFTLSANVGSGPLKLIPEIRFESAEQEIFLDGDSQATKSATQFLVAAVYAF